MIRQAHQPKRAFYVMGVPSSGTRLMVRLLIAAGCAGNGDGDHYQRWDEELPTEDLIVFRRHLPVAAEPPAWVNHPNVITALQNIGYVVHAVIMVRDWHSTLASQHVNGYTVDAAHSALWTRTLWRQMFDQLPGDVDFTVVTYESLVQRPGTAVNLLFAYLGLEQMDEYEPLKDGNEKYYAGVLA